MAHERICIVCGKTYKYCSRCPKYASLATWHYSFDTEECYEFYGILDKYNAKKKSADEANKMIEDLNIKHFKVDDLHSIIKKIYNDMLSELSVSKIQEQVLEAPEFLEEETLESSKEEKIEVFENQEIEIKPRRRRRRTNQNQ